VLIYEQTCAAEKRRRRKRGLYPDPPKRLFISTAVCEGCGDCSAQSTCVSLMPVETDFGTKRRIDQSNCNKDYSCLNGFCPSFITIHGAEPRKPKALTLDERLFDALPAAPRAPLGRSSYNLMVAGIGGTGVVTVGALIGMAAHLEGLSISLFDMTGLSQKNGAVYSHIRIGRTPGDISTQRLGAGDADLLMAFDLVAALSPEAGSTIAVGRTRAIANAAVAPTAAFQFDRDLSADPAVLLASLRKSVGKEALSVADASALALAILGDTIGANLFLVGVAVQHGLLPVGSCAIEQAVELNGVAIPFNLRAFRLGRLFVVDPERVLALLPTLPGAHIKSQTLDELIAHRSAHLRAYQSERLAERYRALVERVRLCEVKTMPGADALTHAVARTYAKLLAYKDEYEVARLLSSDELHDEIARTFEAGGRIAFNMAPPILAGAPTHGRPRKREFGAWTLPLLRALARLRMLRGTWVDPFGHNAERKMERELITEYEALAERVISVLEPTNHGHAVNILSAANEIRGFGPVKEESVKSYRDLVSDTEQRFFSAD
jgi:indolepyruvate ferredoxin oxidoreductase